MNTQHEKEKQIEHNESLELRLINAGLLAELKLVKDGWMEPVRKFLNGVYGFICKNFLKKSQLTIVPLDGVVHERKTTYLSINEDPKLYAKINNPATVKEKWVEIEIHLEKKDIEGIRLYFDYGQGFSEELSLLIKYDKLKNIGKAKFYLPNSLPKFRIDPMESKGEFDIKDAFLRVIPKLDVKSLTPSEAEFYKKNNASDKQVKLSSGLNVVKLGVGHNYRALTSDPNFNIENAPDLLSGSGWYLFEVDISIETQRDMAKIYLGLNGDCLEKNSVSVNVTNGLVGYRVAFLDEWVNTLRFDPVENEVDFSINKLALKYISSIEASNVMKAYLEERDVKAEGDSIEELYELYLDHYNNKQGLDYLNWIDLIESKSGDSQEEKKGFLNSIENAPLISIIMPTYKTDVSLLKEAIDSVLNQSYTSWELCICDDASSDQKLISLLKEYDESFENIKVKFRSENGHISCSSNDALSLATGEYVLLMDHDDLLSKDALYYVAKEICYNNKLKIIYSDEDKIDKLGRRFDPHFKSDLNLDLLYSHNYISHLGVYQKELVDEVGGFRVGLEGSQDYDLLLRCLAKTNEADVKHIPKILYHWRVVEGSTALDSGEKDYTTAAGKAALENYFQLINAEKVVVKNGPANNTYKIEWPIPEINPLVSLIIPTRDGLNVLKLAVESILEKTSYKNYEIIIVDNGSVKQETFDYFESLKNNQKIRIIDYDKPFNYSAINNYAVSHAKGEIIGLINNDVEVISPNWLDEMVMHVLRPEIGCVGAKLYYSNDTIQHGGVILGLGGVAGHSHKYFDRSDYGYFRRLTLVQNLSAVTAACLIVRKSVYDSVGGLEEKLQVAFNDVDFCMKVDNAGYRNLWTPYAELYHHESISRGHEDTPEKINRFKSEIEYMKAKWGLRLSKDRFYNENLTDKREDFSIEGL
jgi:glycosyltransferase involved in cell wall biosynthesis